MLSKIRGFVKEHKGISIIGLLLIIAGGYFGYQRLNGDENTIKYVMAEAEKGTIVVSVSGSGQVSVLDQADVKTQTSGDLTAIYFDKDQEVKEGQILAVLDSGAAQRAVSDAEIVLEQAKVKLDDLVSSPDAQSLLAAENTLAQAERDLEKAKESYETVEADAEDTLSNAYEDGYSDVSSAFFKLSDYMKDLKDVIGTEQNSQEYISAYELVLGMDSSFTQRLLTDYDTALSLFNENLDFFRTIYRDDNRDTIYQLISDTLETTKAVSRALESARHMFDAVTMSDYYKHFNVLVSQVDKMQSKIESDLSSVFSSINSLQNTIDTIDQTVEDTPGKIVDAELAFKSAQEKLEDKKTSLEEIKAGADVLDIKAQQNVVAQKEAALADAKEGLANCYIRAPFDGVIAEVSDKVKKGDSVSSGTVLGTIITKQKIAEITLNEVDAANVKVDQKVTLTFDALSDVTISGKVLEVDTIGQASQGVVSYGVKIALDTDVEQVKPGMSVTADIITEAKPDVLVLPNSAIKSQGDSYYVQLVQVPEETKQQLLASISGTTLSESPKIQIIEIGLSNDTSTEIISGLEEGDVVVTSTLNSSSQTQTSSSNFQVPGGGSQRVFFRGE